MSLIEEALRRQHDEDDANAPGKTSPPPVGGKPSSVPPPPAKTSEEPADSPPPVPEPPLEETAEEPAKKGRPVWVTLLAVLLGVALLLGGIAAVAIYGFTHWLKQAGEEIATELETELAKHPDIQITVEPQQPETPPTVVEVQPEVVTPEVATPEPPSTETTPTTPPTVVETPPTTAPIRPRVPVVWPRLALSGVMGHGPQGLAIINREHIGIGETVNGVTVVGIQDQGVELSYKGERRFLKVGSSLD